jgi:hypothetical protein
MAKEPLGDGESSYTRETSAAVLSYDRYWCDARQNSIPGIGAGIHETRMGLIAWALTAMGALAVAVTSRLITDDVKAWIPRVTERIIAHAVSKLPEDQRSRFLEEWQSYVSDTPGDICKLRAAFGFVVASWKMARELRERPESQIGLECKLQKIELLVADMQKNSAVSEKLVESCRDFRILAEQCRSLADLCPERIRELVRPERLLCVDRLEALGLRRMEALPRHLETLGILAKQMTAGLDTPQMSDAIQSIVLELQENTAVVLREVHEMRLTSSAHLSSSLSPSAHRVH